MRVRKLVIVGTVLLISLSIFLLWTEGTAKEKEESLESLYTSLGIEKITPPIKAQDFTLENLEGSQVSLKDFEGKVVFLNFWASWCGPCQWEMPAIEKLWKKFKEEEFVILAIDIQERRETVKSFMENKGYTFPVLLDLKGKVARVYEVRGIPTTFLVNSEGKIVGKAVGARDWASEDAFELINQLLTNTAGEKEGEDKKKDNPTSTIPTPSCC